VKPQVDDTFNNSVKELIENVAAGKARTYHEYCDREDLAQEMWLWALGKGRRTLEGLLGKGDLVRAARELATVAKRYGEAAKAAYHGYEIEDLAWYSPAIIAKLLPFVLDPEWEGLNARSADNSSGRKKSDKRESFDLQSAVFDVRRAIEKLRLPTDEEAYEGPDGLPLLERIGDFLGGDYPGSPSHGRGRKAMSNATASHVLALQER
jgi:hypothetical protein